RISGSSLASLGTDEARLKKTVMYCCDETAEGTPRLLNAASRMQLLSAPASVEFASRLQNRPAGGNANAEFAHSSQNVSTLQALEPVWRELLHSPNWRPVLNQYQTLLQVRELMVHPDDVIASSRFESRIRARKFPPPPCLSPRTSSPFHNPACAAAWHAQRWPSEWHPWHPADGPVRWRRPSG